LENDEKKKRITKDSVQKKEEHISEKENITNKGIGYEKNG